MQYFVDYIDLLPDVKYKLDSPTFVLFLFKIPIIYVYKNVIYYFRSIMMISFKYFKVI